MCCDMWKRVAEVFIKLGKKNTTGGWQESNCTEDLELNKEINKIDHKKICLSTWRNKLAAVERN